MAIDIDSSTRRDEDAMLWFLKRIEPFLDLWFRPVVRGGDRIPEGSALFVGNHNSSMLTPDTYIACREVYRRQGMSAVPYGLAHEAALRLPLIGRIVTTLGGVRANHDNANRLFAEKKKVLVYPGGDIDSCRPTRQRDEIIFGGRRGYIRLALRHGVPIVPVVAAGAHTTYYIFTSGRGLAKLLHADRLVRMKVLPMVLSVPWGLTIGPPLPHFPLPTKIYVEFLEPIHFERSGEDASSDSAYVEACHDRVLGGMQSALTRLAEERRADRRERVANVISGLIGRFMPS